MDCERKGCGHPLAVHDPCSVAKCRCRGYLPRDRKVRVATLTDVVPPPRETLAALREREMARGEA